MKIERRFRGRMGDEYSLIRRILPHFDELQAQVGRELARRRKQPARVIEIGCGDGRTTRAILAACPEAFVTAIDSEPKMIARAKQALQAAIRGGRCEVVRADARQFLAGRPAESAEAVASAMTLHNLTFRYRRELHREIHRVLVRGGLFVNADKYAPQDDTARFEALRVALGRFFGTLVPMRRYALLKEWVLHNVADQAPDRVMKEGDAIQELREIGFAPISLRDRANMEAVLVARKRSGRR